MSQAFQASDPSFCPSCGTLLPSLPASGDVTCLSCKYRIPIEAFAQSEISYTIEFNKRDALRKKKGKEDEIEDPVIERRCPQCGHEEMSYTALQLRSADEGQTVFFTCLKCKFKESENS